MRQGILRGDVAVLREGVSLGWAFGLGSLEQLARVAETLETGIYRRGALEAVPEGVRVRLDNPPLRIGAFRSVGILWDGRPVDPTSATVATDSRPAPRILSDVSDADPLCLGVGEGSEYRFPTEPGDTEVEHRVRIEWTGRAIPPRVWLEFRDQIRRGPGSR